MRQFVRQMKRQQTAARLGEMSAGVLGKVRVNPYVVKAQTILLYYSLDDEVDTHQFVEELARQGKTVLLPVVMSDADLELRRYRGPKDLRSGFFDIMEPVGETFHDYDKIEVAVVPGMAFDRRGNRLGRGKGYYDRLLAQLPDAYKIGVCFPFQLVPGVPAAEHDIPMDEVIA